LGQIGEMAFTLQATMLGFTVAEPCGAPEVYDRLVDNGNRCWRVQVKTTKEADDQGIYFVDCGHNGITADGRKSRHARYRDDEIDFLVVYVFPENRWYVIPWKALQGRSGLAIHSERSQRPNRNRGNLAQYEEAWHLLWEGGKKEKAQTGVVDLMAFAEEPGEAAGDSIREFVCGVLKDGAMERFRMWTAGEPPTPETVGRFLNAMFGGGKSIRVGSGEMGRA